MRNQYGNIIRKLLLQFGERNKSVNHFVGARRAGKMIGFADLTQANIGLQAGGQAYSEVIVFENEDALNKFKNNKLEFSANASAVALKAGAAGAARFENGISVFVKPKGGLMFEVSIGGQKFTFKAAENANRA